MADAFRMAFSYSADGEISLIHSYRADMAIPLNEAVAEAPGYHLVGRDADGNELFRIGARGLFVEFHEAFTQNGHITQIPAQRHGTFVAVVPYREALEHVAIVKVEYDAPKVDADLMRGLLTPGVVETELTRFKMSEVLA